MTPPTPDNVESIFRLHPPAVYERLHALRRLIYDVAQSDHRIGTIEETLKWGQPSYLPSATKSGTTLRIDADKTADCGVALYVHCTTRLVEEWRSRFADLDLRGTRSLHLDAIQPLPVDTLRQCIQMALTYHLNPADQALI